MYRVSELYIIFIFMEINIYNIFLGKFVFMILIKCQNKNSVLELLVMELLGNSDLGPVANCRRIWRRKVSTVIRFIDMATYVKTTAWVIEHCRNPVPKDGTVISCEHLEDAGPAMLKVGRFEFKLHHPLAIESWKSFQEGILFQFKWGAFFEDSAPTWIYM